MSKTFTREQDDQRKEHTQRRKDRREAQMTRALLAALACEAADVLGEDR